MQSISPRSTKAQILEAYIALEAKAAEGPSWEQVAAKLRQAGARAIIEGYALVKDCYNAGAIARQWVSVVTAELSRPVLRSES